MADTRVLRVGTLNLASGRGPDGRPVAADVLANAVRDIGVDVLALQEVDADQPRSAGVDQAAVVAATTDLAVWRAAVTLTGTPGPDRAWRAVEPPLLRGPGRPPAGPEYGTALLCRGPVHRWSVLPLGHGRTRLPLRAPDPRTGRTRTWWIPDEPRAAVAAELDGVTVVATHLSFATVTAVRQLRLLRRWIDGLPQPVLVAGDLNLPGSIPARLLGADPLVRARSYPAAAPRVQLDHLLGRGVRARNGEARRLVVGDHRLLTAELLLS